MNLLKVYQITLLLIFGVSMILFPNITKAASTASAQIFVFANTDNFVGVELKSSLDNYSSIFANMGVKYVGIGARISSKQTSGVFISPLLYFEYNSKANMALNIGYTFKISNFNNIVFLIEGGAKKLLDKPEASLNFGLYLPF
ncbi:hypothetical protein [Fervidobacterium sp.]